MGCVGSKIDLQLAKSACVSYSEMRTDLPKTPRETKQRWVDALTWVHGVSGVTGWVHSSSKECAAAIVYQYNQYNQYNVVLVYGQVRHQVARANRNPHYSTDRTSMLVATIHPCMKASTCGDDPNLCSLLRSYEYNLVDDIVATILETLQPHARQVTTHAVGLAERVEGLLQLQCKARHGELPPEVEAK